MHISCWLLRLGGHLQNLTVPRIHHRNITGQQDWLRSQEGCTFIGFYHQFNDGCGWKNQFFCPCDKPFSQSLLSNEVEQFPITSKNWLPRTQPLIGYDSLQSPSSMCVASCSPTLDKAPLSLSHQKDNFCLSPCMIPVTLLTSVMCPYWGMDNDSNKIIMINYVYFHVTLSIYWDLMFNWDLIQHHWMTIIYGKK